MGSFLGPAPLRPFNELRFKYNWHWFWDTGNGDIGNNGVHQMDVARWGLGVGAPRRISSAGGKYIYEDDQETPNTQIATFGYGEKELMLEVRGLPTGGEAGMTSPWGNLSATVFLGADGYMTLDDDGCRICGGEKLELAGEQKGGGDGTALHIANFLDAVRQRRPEMLRAGISEGALSTDLCHFANVSYRVGRMLDFDAATGRFHGDDEANALLTRSYRRPYVVPDLRLREAMMTNLFDRRDLLKWTLSAASLSVNHAFPDAPPIRVAVSGPGARGLELRRLRFSCLLGLSCLLPAAGQDMVKVLPVEIEAVLVTPGAGIQTFQRFRGQTPYPGLRWSEAGPVEKVADAASKPDFPESSVAYLRWFWHQIEPEPGKYRWEIIDLALEEARRHGQTLDIRLGPDDPHATHAGVVSAERRPARQQTHGQGRSDLGRPYSRSALHSSIGVRWSGRRARVTMATT